MLEQHVVRPFKTYAYSPYLLTAEPEHVFQDLEALSKPLYSSSKTVI
jgi:hypothetical protein